MNIRCCWTALFLLSVGLPGVSAQTFSIDWYAIAAGGGTSSGGPYTVTGTIGQPAAGAVMSGGEYSITGGFWSMLSIVETPGAPALRMILTSTNTVVVTWPLPSTGWELQQNSQLTAPTWTTYTQAINEIGTNRFIVVTPESGQRFYRLAKP